MTIAVGGLRTLEKQLHATKQTSAEIKCLPIRHQGTMQLELPIISWILEVSSSHMISSTQLQSIIK